MRCFLLSNLLSSLLSDVTALHNINVYNCRLLISGRINRPKASATEMVVLGFGSRAGQTKDIEIGIHSYRQYPESYRQYPECYIFIATITDTVYNLSLIFSVNYC